jgi:hypothetical protein
MDFIDRLRELATRLPRQIEHIQTEEATKNALILPFIAALGYNVFDPTEVTPELNADVGVKKGEKVDYAILKDGKPIILFECKHHATDLAQTHASQLYRYFSVTDARFSVLTNGIVYWFYTDLDAPNKMDAKPFFEFNLLDIRDGDVDELKKFSKSAFDLNHILTTASELKYTREIVRLLADQLREPSDDFVKFVVSHVYSGRMTQPIREQFAQLTRGAFNSLVNDRIADRLRSVLNTEAGAAPTTSTVTPAATPPTQPVAGAASGDEPLGSVVTTDEEVEAYYIIRAILREVVNVKRVTMRDVQSYCGVLLDDNNRRVICRLYFNSTQKYLGLFDSGQQERVPLDSLDDIYKYVDRLKATVARLETRLTKPAPNA